MSKEKEGYEGGQSRPGDPTRTRRAIGKGVGRHRTNRRGNGITRLLFNGLPQGGGENPSWPRCSLFYMPFALNISFRAGLLIVRLALTFFDLLPFTGRQAALPP